MKVERWCINMKDKITNFLIIVMMPIVLFFSLSVIIKSMVDLFNSNVIDKPDDDKEETPPNENEQIVLKKLNEETKRTMLRGLDLREVHGMDNVFFRNWYPNPIYYNKHFFMKTYLESIVDVENTFIEDLNVALKHHKVSECEDWLIIEFRNNQNEYVHSDGFIFQGNKTLCNY